MSEPIRVLQAFVANDKGGLTGYICQNYKCIDKSKIQFDFLTYDQELEFEEEFKKMGARFYHISRASYPLKMYKELLEIQKNNNYNIVHYNTSYTNLIPIIIFWLLGINNIIVHSHSTQIDESRSWLRTIKTYLNFVFRISLPLFTTKFYACSIAAGKWCFGNRKFTVLHNSIDTKKYIFNEKTKKIIREKLKISDKCFVVGHIGRFTYQKNHSFLIDIFGEVVRKKPNSLLLLIGGYNEQQKYYDEIEKKIKNCNLVDKVKILGLRNDVADLMQAMDCFVLPSRFEGLPIVGIEAQTSGLPCIFSDVITKEVVITKLVQFVNLNNLPSDWANTIVMQAADERKNMQSEVASAGYEQKEEIKKIENIYLKF